MDKLINPGRIIFATGIIALGVICIIAKDFIVGRPSPWPEGFDINPGLAYLSRALLVLAAGAILLKRKAGPAALLIATLIFGCLDVGHYGIGLVPAFAHPEIPRQHQ